MGRTGMKKTFGIIHTVFVSFFFILSILIGLSAQWMLDTWPNLKMEEVMFQFQQGLGGTGGDMIMQFMIHCGFPVIAVLIMLIVLLVSMKGKPKG